MPGEGLEPARDFSQRLLRKLNACSDLSEIARNRSFTCLFGPTPFPDLYALVHTRLPKSGQQSVPDTPLSAPPYPHTAPAGPGSRNGGGEARQNRSHPQTECRMIYGGFRCLAHVDVRVFIIRGCRLRAQAYLFAQAFPHRVFTLPGAGRLGALEKGRKEYRH